MAGIGNNLIRCLVETGSSKEQFLSRLNEILQITSAKISKYFQVDGKLSKQLLFRSKKIQEPSTRPAQT